jgi:cytoskeleton protein RodZ
MNAVSEIQPTAGTAGSTPGALLRQGREQRGLTVQQVSEELHLDAWLVEALEQNRFLALGAPVYAKGHLRKYAVLLGLSPELILARYQEIAEPPPPPQLPPREALLTPDPMVRGFDWRRVAASIDWRSIDWRTYGIIGGLLVVAGGLWLVTNLLRSSGDAPQVVAAAPSESATQGASQSTTPDTTTPQTTSPGTTVPGTTPETPQPSATPTQAPPVAAAQQQRPTPAEATPTTPQRPVIVSARVTQSNTAAAPPVQPGTVSKREPPKVATTPATPPALPESRVAASAPAPVTEPGPTAAPNTPQALPAAPEGPQVSLRLEFAVASWAEVSDRDGRRLLYAVGDPSRPRTISGTPPLKVTLGQAGSVQARVNGRPIAIPRRIGQESASFTVGANGSIR